ncbi:MAG TPA: glycerophosphodiester phosphodiesterase family protein [Ilumatobacteraceae bacterium]|nr:glycerophosphodiester phosphodiesterase family protein [Ilumatobacteraceae bacterium]
MTALAGCTTSPPTATKADTPPTGNPFRIGRPLVIPHGGGDGLFPENTLYAYEHSIPLGGDVIDADVRLTADGIPIAFHDATLQRTTNGTGNVEDKSYAELADLDAGWNFMKDGAHPFRDMGIRIPTIRSILEVFPDTLVTLDLKDLRTVAVAPLCDLLRTLKRTNDVYIGVDTTEQVTLFRQLCPEVRTSGTDADRRAMRAARAAHDASFVTNQLVSQPEFVASDGTRRITPDYLAYSHSKNIAVLTWVVDDATDMLDLIDMGIDGIYTRRPDVMVKLLEDMGIK